MIYIRKIGIEPIPYGLLLMADPSTEMINQYLNKDYLYVVENEGDIVGAYVLYPLNDSEMEIKNIVVTENYQGRGIGTSMLSHAEKITRELKYKKLIIGTADVSYPQQRLYKKNGFVAYDIKNDFFINKYPHPIYDNGKLCVNMILFKKAL